MPAVRRGPVLYLFWRLHKWILSASGGTIAARVDGFPVLLLRTIGRKTGEPRTNALAYVGHGDAYVVVGTNAGADFDPAWVQNLRAQPDAEITIRGRKIAVRAGESAGEERDNLYEKFVQTSMAYGEYKRRTRREIPVVILEPVE
ncbi:MAG: nitroreductase/quinone reductase family protein [Anaerolineales bacterium]